MILYYCGRQKCAVGFKCAEMSIIEAMYVRVVLQVSRNALVRYKNGYSALVMRNVGGIKILGNDYVTFTHAAQFNSFNVK